MSYKNQITERFEQFGMQVFGSGRGWKKKYAEALGLTQGGLQLYLTGKSLPGNKMQEKLSDLGCDINWLMTGNAKGTEISSDKTVIQFSLSGQLTPAEKEKFQRVIDELEKVSKTDPEAAEKIIKIMDTIFRK